MSNPTGDALKAYRDGLVITDKHRERSNELSMQLCMAISPEAITIVEQDTARKTAKILDDYAERIATASANGNENDVKFLRKMAGVQRAAFNIKD